MLILFAVATVFYASFMFYSWLGLLLSRSTRHTNINSISVIIAARNEAANLPGLLQSISQLDYPSFEVIIVNDHSTDASAAILDAWDGKQQIRVLHLTGSSPGLVGKKAAIDFGIKHSTYEILAFTDADCEVNPGWLHEINASMGDVLDYLLGFSLLKRSPQGSIMRLRNFERSAYYALAAAGLHWRIPITSMACNMAYRKSVFKTAGGFGELGALRSGDDDLLLMKMMPRIRKGAFNPSCAMRVVSYDGEDSAVHHQSNIRRASKFQFFPTYLKLLAAFVFIYYAMFYYIGVTTLINPAWSLGWFLIGIKTFFELLLVCTLFIMVKEPRLLIFYPLQILLFPAQFIFYAIRGSLGKYHWK